MKQRSDHSRVQDTHHKKNPPADAAQQAKDEKERSKHPASENALESTQEKNPVPDESKRQADVAGFVTPRAFVRSGTSIAA
ncbi:hypothetical protein VSR68_05485 [Paraburkholderia phymatum]|uniref:hypothetical protein n=1 Tax=Paraburkholderia phymatum TaxID=148447 RepID=UPI00317067D9